MFKQKTPFFPIPSSFLRVPSLRVPKYIFYRYGITAEWHNGYKTCAEWQSRTTIVFGPKCSSDQLRVVSARIVKKEVGGLNSSAEGTRFEAP